MTGKSGWEILATRLLEPVQLPLGEFLAVLRFLPDSDHSAPGPAPLSTVPPDPPGVDDGHVNYALELLKRHRASQLAYLRVLRRMTLAELQDLAAQKSIPYAGKAVTRLRLDLAGWAPPNPARPPEMRARPGDYLLHADSAQAAIQSYLEAEYMHLRRKTKRREDVLKSVQLEADTIRREVRSYWDREGWDDANDESPSGETSQSARMMLKFLDEDDYTENGDLTGTWSQEEEEAGLCGAAVPILPAEAYLPGGSLPVWPSAASGKHYPSPAAFLPAGWASAPPPAACSWAAVPNVRQETGPSLGDVPTPISRLRGWQATNSALEAEGRHLLTKARQLEELLRSAHSEVQQTNNHAPDDNEQQ